jgi:hypothetical protein
MESHTGLAHALLDVPMVDCSLVGVWAEGPLVPLELTQALQHEEIFFQTPVHHWLNEVSCFEENSKDFAAYCPLLETGHPMQLLALVGRLCSA